MGERQGEPTVLLTVGIAVFTSANSVFFDHSSELGRPWEDTAMPIGCTGELA
jgi:hypothetical protein